MKKLLCLLAAGVLALGLLAPAGLAEEKWDFYLIPDSDTRELTEAEIRQWSFDSMWYLINEIFARHGFVFSETGEFGTYFGKQAWYTPNENPINQEACYPQISNREWANEHLIKVVMEKRIANDARNAKGNRSVQDYIALAEAGLEGFSVMPGGKRDVWRVFFAPTDAAWRGGEPEASLDAARPYLALGWENGFLMVAYTVAEGSLCTGYVLPSRDVSCDRQLEFASTTCTVAADCAVTSDPLGASDEMTRLEVGDSVTYLGEQKVASTGKTWAYIECRIESMPARGYVPAEAVFLPSR